MKPLKPRQERFCRRFAEFGCAITAARAAGFAPRSTKAAAPAATRNDDFYFAGKLF
jgi:phage terminase small subunit